MSERVHKSMFLTFFSRRTFLDNLGAEFCVTMPSQHDNIPCH